MRRAPLPLLLLLLHCAAGAGVFELQVLEFSNPRLSLRAGGCCGGAGAAACAAPCRTRFALCLKEYQSAAAPSACSFGRARSPVLGADTFTLADPLYTLALHFTFRWTRSFTLILQAYDDFDYGDSEDAGLIEEAWWSGIVEPGAAWHALRHTGAVAAVAYRVRVLCAPNYYNSTCTAFCRPRDDKFGHYSCSPHGRKVCLPGWQGDNCEIPVCKEGCHPTHGRCDKPGDCDCRPGWRGELCAECQPYPGCKHGYCNGSSWDCTCDTNWGGILCDQDLNYCGTHEPCRHGGTCENTAPDQYLCTCAEGFSGVDCEKVDNPCAPAPCAHGSCALAPAPPGFSCACEEGWGGALCDRDLDDCASAPCRRGATCRDRLAGFSCECAPGWTGQLCDQDVDECKMSGSESRADSDSSLTALGPCVNAAACNNTAGGFACSCLAGWAGARCELNVDDCAGQCLNGATCIDLVDDFHCACAAGWAGRTCARDVDDCASRPCRHGGECVDLLDAYRCICPVGFSGKDCELSTCVGRYCPGTDDRDHCASNPCGNGAPCYTAQSDYYCHCAPGWTGKNCTQRTDLDACASSPCRNNASCVPRGSDFACVCLDGWTGKTCAIPTDDESICTAETCANGGTCVVEGGVRRCACAAGWGGATCGDAEPCACANGGTCVVEGGVRRCACAGGWGGARCERARDACAGRACVHGACVAAGGRAACACAPGWTGPACDRPVCGHDCPAPARCAPPPRNHCLCPADDLRCIEMLSETERWDAVEAEVESWVEAAEACAGELRNASWWRACNVCECGASGAPACSRVWCGAPDCRGPRALPCRPDEVCVPTAPALCVRGPCAEPGECRRVSGRRVAAGALPAPAGCWPGAGGPAPAGCVRARLALAATRVARGAHVERACSALRRAMAPALRALDRPLVLLCDLAHDTDDEIDLALWAGESDEEESAAGAAAAGAALHVLAELVARRRLAREPLLAAAVRVRGEPAPAARAPPAPAALLALGAALPLLLAGGAGAALALRRRRAAAARARRRDEDKSNNLQNEENLRRVANPLAPARPLALFKAHNADARNHTPPRDKELSLRALPPAPARPDRLTVLV